jgi:spermidine synthase
MVALFGAAGAAGAIAVAGLGARPAIESIAADQATRPDWLSGIQLDIAIAAAAAVSLFLELVLIRWHGTVFEVFAFYKNVSLMACFLGLGLGYALARQVHIPLVLTPPLLAFQMGLLLILRHGLTPVQRAALGGTPIAEQLNLGSTSTRGPYELVAVYAFLAVVFLLTALALVPVGQLAGRLMDRAPRLRAYGLNLLGSLAGVAAALTVSWLYLPPAAWFALGLGGLLFFQAADRRALAAGLAGLVAVMVLLAWPVSFGWEQIYSPYQLLERGPGENGLSQIRAAGQYYQRIHNLSEKVQAGSHDDAVRLTAAHYELPYRALGRTAGDVLIVGAGTGNDVAAALRRGARRIDAVEIDPAIVRIGRLFHPEAPYDSPRVAVIENDARTFLRTTDLLYDLIVYGLLDSHTLLSHASNVRLDSFVYTLEGLREARARLTRGGVLSLSFSVISPELGRKIYRMLGEAFDGQPPLAIRGRFSYDGSVTFLESESGRVELPEAELERGDFSDISYEFANPELKADVSTDDWPFFYMPRRVYPISYLGMAALILALSGVLVGSLSRQRPAAPDAAFFLLGAGFLLIQTKGITELGLAFGNTWQVIGLVIAAMLAFAFLANLAVATLRLTRPFLPFVLLLASLALGWWVARAGGLPPTAPGRIGTLALLTGPVFFSGIVFSTLLARAENVSRALSANLFGALVGGLLEYNAMLFGFGFLYVIALGLYGAAMLASLFVRRPT